MAGRLGAMALGLACGLGLAGGALAERTTPQSTTPALGNGIDCTKVSVEYIDDPSLTREERLAVMDRALNRSLTKFEYCQDPTKSTSAAVEGGGGGAVSTAASDVSASEPEAAAAPAQGRTNPELAGTAPYGSSSGEWTERAEVTNPDVALNGKVPEDIPPGDNDSVLEAQIRQAALSEEDFEVRARLWDEYRRYKGLPEDKQ